MRIWPRKLSFKNIRSEREGRKEINSFYMQVFPISLYPQRQILAFSFGFSHPMTFQLQQTLSNSPQFLLKFSSSPLRSAFSLHLTTLSASLPQLQVPSFPTEIPWIATPWLFLTKAGSVAPQWEVQSPVSSRRFCLTRSLYLEECNMKLAIDQIRYMSS